MNEDTIAALSTPAGMGAISVIRISGPEALQIAGKVFISPSGKSLSAAATHTAHFGTVMDGDSAIDEVIATVFRAPKSFTGEDTVEFSCHGSVFIQQQMLQLLVRRGARMAMAGEFTKRAFLNGRMDLSQAYASHATAMNQMRGGYSGKIASLKNSLTDFAALLELELDFSDQDVEFADRTRLTALVHEIKSLTRSLADSFSVGNAIKNGIPVSIIGAPNVGKSTLLNALLGEEKAIVSHIPGTTRDSIEDRITISGLSFRFIDTAGLRDTDDFVEKIGIERTYKKIDEASVIIYLLDAGRVSASDMDTVTGLKKKYQDKHFIVAANKSDEYGGDFFDSFSDVLMISALTGDGLDELREKIVGFVNIGDVSDRIIVTNARHYEALVNACSSLENVEAGLSNGFSADLLAVDVRDAISHLGEITGDISSDDILGVIFSRFCIGK